MGSRRTEMLGDLIRQGMRIIVGCRRCHAQRSLDPFRILEWLGGDRRWVELRFRCLRCGSRDVRRMIQTRD